MADITRSWCAHSAAVTEKRHAAPSSATSAWRARFFVPLTCCATKPEKGLMPDLPTIAIVGGTGAEGSGLAARLAHAGYLTILGSRSADKAAATAEELNRLTGKQNVRGTGNREAAAAASIVLLTVPFAA